MTQGPNRNTIQPSAGVDSCDLAPQARPFGVQPQPSCGGLGAERRAAIDLRLGDCLEGMKALGDKSVDHVICDPAYEAEAHSKGRRVGKGWKSSRQILVKAIPYPPITQEEREGIALQSVRVSRGWVLFFCQSEALHLWKEAIEEGGGQHIRMGVFRKLDAQPQYSGDRPGVGWEGIEIAWAGTGRTRWNGGGNIAIWESSGEFRLGLGGQSTRAIIDGQKPLDLMEKLLRDFSNPGELICDPCAGAGTTAVACKRLARRFLGWERTPATHAAAVKRIEAAREQFQLPRMPKPRQQKLVLP